MPTSSRSLPAAITRGVVGWIFLVAFLAMVALWTVLGFSPHFAADLPKLFADFGDVSQWWPILAGVIAGGLAAWCLAPGIRIGGGGEGMGREFLRLWAAVILGVSSLLMMFAAYWPCAGDEAQVWSALRKAAEAFEGYVAEPFGSVAGCPAEFPQSLMAGVLFSKTTLVLVAAFALTQIFGGTIDWINAWRARQVIIFSGVSDETLEMLRTVANGITDRQTLLVLDAGPGLARAREAVRDIHREFARDRRRARAIVLPLDIVDRDAVAAFATPRRRRGIQGLYLMSPDSASNLRALDSFLPSDAAPEEKVRTEVPGRVVVRIDNPWHAEDWRRKQMIGRPGWLFDALSVREMAARHVVNQLKKQGVDRVVISGGTSFSLAVLAELSLEHRLDDFLAKSAAEIPVAAGQPKEFKRFVPTTPKVLLVGAESKEIADHFREQLKRFGIDHGDEIFGKRKRDAESYTAAMARLVAEGLKPALIHDSDLEHDPTFLAVRNPTWTIFSWDLSVQGVTDEPLLGQLWMVGPTLTPIPDFGLDIWDRLGAMQHLSYLIRQVDGVALIGDPKHGMWKSLSPFARESNIRSFAAFTRSVRDLASGPRRLGTDLGSDGSDVSAPIVSEEDFEDLAEHEHESWMAHHEEYGYVYGPERKGRRHPDMRPWSALEDKDKQKDRDSVHVTNASLRALGFILVKAR